MPFPPQPPQPFSKESVESISPGQTGCYGVFRYGYGPFGIDWIYVGKGDIRERLLEHLGGDNYCITICGPTHWVSATTPDFDQLEKELIRELMPKCNPRVA
jgi:hypothetical protein